MAVLSFFTALGLVGLCSIILLFDVPSWFIVPLWAMITFSMVSGVLGIMHTERMRGRGLAVAGVVISVLLGAVFWLSGFFLRTTF